jgi:hypothetical protein
MSDRIGDAPQTSNIGPAEEMEKDLHKETVLSELVLKDFSQLKIEAENSLEGSQWSKQEKLASVFNWKPFRDSLGVEPSLGWEDRVVLWQDIQPFLVELCDPHLLHALVFEFLKSLRILVPVVGGGRTRHYELGSFSDSCFGLGIAVPGAHTFLSSNANFAQDRTQVKSYSLITR